DELGERNVLGQRSALSASGGVRLPGQKNPPCGILSVCPPAGNGNEGLEALRGELARRGPGSSVCVTGVPARRPASGGARWGGGVSGGQREERVTTGQRKSVTRS